MYTRNHFSKIVSTRFTKVVTMKKLFLNGKAYVIMYLYLLLLVRLRTCLQGQIKTIYICTNALHFLSYYKQNTFQMDISVQD